MVSRRLQSFKYVKYGIKIKISLALNQKCSQIYKGFNDELKLSIYEKVDNLKFGCIILSIWLKHFKNDNYAGSRHQLA